MNKTTPPNQPYIPPTAQEVANECLAKAYYAQVCEKYLEFLRENPTGAGIATKAEELKTELEEYGRELEVNWLKSFASDLTAGFGGVIDEAKAASNARAKYGSEYAIAKENLKYICNNWKEANYEFVIRDYGAHYDRFLEICKELGIYKSNDSEATSVSAGEGGGGADSSDNASDFPADSSRGVEPNDEDGGDASLAFTGDVVVPHE